MDIARQLLDENIQVAIGGFHTSGCIAMLPELPDDLKRRSKWVLHCSQDEAEEDRLIDVLQGCLS
jgi:hypothetical protein